MNRTGIGIGAYHLVSEQPYVLKYTCKHLEFEGRGYFNKETINFNPLNSNTHTYTYTYTYLDLEGRSLSD